MLSRNAARAAPRGVYPYCAASASPCVITFARMRSCSAARSAMRDIAAPLSRHPVDTSAREPFASRMRAYQVEDSVTIRAAFPSPVTRAVRLRPLPSVHRAKRSPFRVDRSAPFGNGLVVWHIGRDGTLASADVLETPVPGYLHSFAMTDRHLVFVLIPFRYLDGAGAFFERLRFQQDQAED